MILMASLIGQWEKMCLTSPTNFAVFAFLFMVCAVEVVLLKLTTISSTMPLIDHGDADLDDPSEYEEDIYYENLRNNYDQWARRRMRQRSQQQELLQHFREQQQQQQYAYYGYGY